MIYFLLYFRWDATKSPVRLLESSYVSPKRQPPVPTAIKTDQKEMLTYNIGTIQSNRQTISSLNYAENSQTNKDNKSNLIRPTSSTTKNLTSYRRELGGNASYDETVKSTNYHQSNEMPLPLELYSGKPYNTDNMHLMSQNNTQPKYSTPIKHLVPIKAPSAIELYDDFTPRGKAAALLGTDTDIHKYKIASEKFENTNIQRVDYTNPHQSYNQRATVTAQHTNSRRNSDPSSNKIPLLEVNRGNDMYESSTHIDIAGHRFHKAGRIGKGEKCASCQENDAFVNEGHRCLDCKLLVHTKCIQNGGVKTLHCEAKRSKRQFRKNFDKATTRNSKYSGTREYTDSADKIISDAKELQLMQDFITQKIYKMDVDCEKPSAVDRVFKQALREFKDNLVAQYSIAHKQKSDTLNIKYRDLISNFEQVMETSCGNKKDDFPLTMGVNAFRGFMNEFMSSRDTEKPKAKRKKEKKRKIDEHTNYNGNFLLLFILLMAFTKKMLLVFLRSHIPINYDKYTNAM